jgi:hypothetical protein
VSPPAGLPGLGRGKISASFPHRTLKKNGQKVGKERSSVGKFSALGHATRPSYGGPKIDSLDFPVDFALWDFASAGKSSHKELAFGANLAWSLQISPPRD